MAEMVEYEQTRRSVWPKYQNMVKTLSIRHIDPALRKELTALYKQIMWLARQPGVTPSMARAWYTHVVAERVKRQIRHFTGSVSKMAADNSSTELRLEHYLRIQTRLTALVEEHLKRGSAQPDAFIQELLGWEQVHIVTRKENYSAMVAKGDYKAAGIELVSWGSISAEARQRLWAKMLRGKVANASDFSPR